MKGLLMLIGGATLFSAVVFGLTGLGWLNFAFFEPKFEAVRRDVMMNSRSYDEGTKRELYRLKIQYQQAKTDEERDTIAAAARHEFQIYPKERLPGDLLTFLDQIGG